MTSMSYENYQFHYVPFRKILIVVEKLGREH